MGRQRQRETVCARETARGGRGRGKLVPHDVHVHSHVRHLLQVDSRVNFRKVDDRVNFHPCVCAFSSQSAPTRPSPGQFTRISHIPLGGRPLLREGGPISEEARPSASFQHARLATWMPRAPTRPSPASEKLTAASTFIKFVRTVDI